VIEVRAAKIGDGATLMTTTQELGRSHGWLEHMTATTEDFEDALFCAHPIVGALIALVDGKPAGTALWHRSFSTMRGKEVMYLEDLSVLPDFRRMGVAEALLKELAILAVRSGYPSIFWMMKDWNEGARKLYIKVGAEVEDGNCYVAIAGDKLLELAA
jgi:GNAT superfamily N-acetyltransferase